MQFMCMSVYAKNHKSVVENELTMVPLSGRIWANSIWLITKPAMTFPIKRFSTVVKFDQAVKSTLKTPFSFKFYSGRIWANSIWFTTKRTMAFLTRRFSIIGHSIFLNSVLESGEIREIDNEFAKPKVNSWYIRQIDSEVAKYEVNL